MQFRSDFGKVEHVDTPQKQTLASLNAPQRHGVICVLRILDDGRAVVLTRMQHQLGYGKGIDGVRFKLDNAIPLRAFTNSDE